MIGFNRHRDDMKAMFFDREVVERAFDRATRRVLSKFGAFVMTAARRSIRPRKRGYSPPGKPPFSRTGLLRENIFFFADQDEAAVIVGPAKLNTTMQTGRRTTPELHEYGGWLTTTDGRRKHYPARPYMGPAFLEEQEKLPDMWRNSITL